MSGERSISIRRLLLPRDTNHLGNVFGGTIMAEIDLAGAVEARHHTQHDVVTVSVGNIEFKRPVRVGDVVTFYTRLVRIGRTSITVSVEVEASRDGGHVPVNVAATEIVYVAVERLPDGSLQKVPVRNEPIEVSP